MSMAPFYGIPGKLKTLMTRIANTTVPLTDTHLNAITNNLNATVSSRADGGIWTSGVAAKIDANISSAVKEYKTASWTTDQSTSWTVPAGVDAVFAIIIGAGGGGGGGSYNSGTVYGGSGGGGGEIFCGWVPVTAGGSATVVIGNGGTGGPEGTPSGTAGGTGGQSSFNGMAAAGGLGGQGGSSSARSGGVGGGPLGGTETAALKTFPSGSAVRHGGLAGNAVPGSSGQGSDGAVSLYTGTGAGVASGSNGVDGTAGSQPGAGGGGGKSVTSTQASSSNGGAGADGAVYIYWLEKE